MSNMESNRSNAKVNGKQTANKLEVKQDSKNSRQEEFLSELDFTFDAEPEKGNNVSAGKGKIGDNQHVSERTAWN